MGFSTYWLFTELRYFQNIINNLQNQNNIKQRNKMTAKVTLLFSFLLSEEKVSLKKWNPYLYIYTNIAA